MKLRQTQEQILAYPGGYMGVAAVPGSGKTFTLALLAAELIARGGLEDEQEVLIVTLVNSAVDIFYRRVSGFLKERGLLPNLGYRVRTLHGLAHDIVRERPALVELGNNFTIVDEREAGSIRSEAASMWLHNHPYDLDEYFKPDLDEASTAKVRREQLPGLVQDMALSFIRYAKDQQLTPEVLRQRLESLPVPLPLAEMGCAIYADYQRALNYRGAVDFDDLIRLALQALQADQEFVLRKRRQWPYLLEDEAQDSSRLQEEILKLLAGPKGNWVRVGDPNQAIYETFTTANPRYLREFIARAGVLTIDLPNSGRSTYSIINLANHLVDWTRTDHPVVAVRDALSAPPYITPTPPGDPQPNPPDAPRQVVLALRKFTAFEEIAAVADSLARWLPEHPDETVAVLAPRNTRCFELVDELRRRGLPFEDGLLRSTTSTRSSAGALGLLLRSLADPRSQAKLAKAFTVWRRDDRSDPAAWRRAERAAELIRKLPQVEDFLWPGPEHDWLEELPAAVEDPDLSAALDSFRRQVRRWQQAILLPVDQLVLTLAQDLLTDPTELAVSHKLAALLRRAAQSNPAWRLPELTEELVLIANNERRFLGFSDTETGFDPQQHKGKVVVATIHKAKGLEWDRVYLMSANTYDFPVGEVGEAYIAEKWFVRDRLNLEAEGLAQLKAALSSAEWDWYQEGLASHAARLDYARERLRLLYVAITRAKQELFVTWNTGRMGDQQPARAMLALKEFWDGYLTTVGAGQLA